MFKKLIFLFVLLNVHLKKLKHEDLVIDKDTLEIKKEFSYYEDQNEIYVQLQIDPPSLMESQSKNLFIQIYSSTQLNFAVLEVQGGKVNRKNIILKQSSDYGTLLFITDSKFYNESEWDEIRQLGVLFIKIWTDSEIKNNKVYFKAQIAEKIELPMGNVYTTMMAPNIKNLSLDWEYPGLVHNKVKKIRFQVSQLEYEKDSLITGKLTHSYETYILNHVFDNILGGILDEKIVSICHESSCIYTVKMTIKGVSVFNFESFLIEDIEELSIYHANEFYDRVYKQDNVTFYKLKYVEEIKEMDVSISLIPVTGNTQLYVNPGTKPLELDKYLYREKGKLAKRVTIKWEELQQMNINDPVLFIAVYTESKGEYLVKIDAHEDHYRGRLSPGYAEAGFVKNDELSKYIVNFQVWEDQKVQFTVKMQVFSGNAELHVKQCTESSFCDFSKDELDNSSKAVYKNNEFEKDLEAPCGEASCNFLIIIIGHENHGTHYEIMVQESSFHYLMTPGHSIILNMLPEKKKHLKFSYPGSHNQDQLYLQIEPYWGTFDIYIDEKENYPSKEKSVFKKNINSEKISLSSSLQNLKVSEAINNSYFQGLLYLTVEATSSSKVNLKFFNKKKDSQQIHSLTAGKLETGSIDNATEIVYYQINLSLEESQAQSVSIDLIPLKGTFFMMASRSGKLPTLQLNDKLSSDNHLDLDYKSYEEHHQYIIGVMAADVSTENELDFLFKIGLSYSNKAVKLQPGVIQTHTLNEKNIFMIQILQEMNDLLLLKSIVDGFNINLCGKFGKDSQEVKEDECDVESNEKQMGMYLEKKDLQALCKKFFEDQSECFLNLSVTGYTDQLFSIGFTYNDLPFQLVKHSLITGPSITKNNFKINFIYHPEKNDDAMFYFNSKGKKLKILTALVDGKDFSSSSSIDFPNQANYDLDAQSTKGYVTTVYYDSGQISSKGTDAEILISIIPEIMETKEKDEPFDLINGFIFQSFGKGFELTRTQVHQEHFESLDTRYYYFYNNGNSGSLDIFVNSSSAAFLDVSISKGKGMNPGENKKALKEEKGVNQVHLNLTQEELDSGTQKSLKGYFTVKVTSTNPAYVNIYWNNKPDLNYTELTPNIPQVVHIFPDRPLYFTFYVDEIEQLKRKAKNGTITVHFKANSQVNIYIKKLINKELVIPSESDNDFYGHLGQKGGVGFIELPSNDKQYCTDCNYVGAIESELEGQISLVVNVEHSSIATTLIEGFTFPDNLLSHKGKTYRYLNADNKPFYINISTLSGFCNVFVDTKKEVTANDAKEYFFLTKDNQTHSFLKIDPSKYQSPKEDFYIRIENPKLDPSTYTITIFKNKIGNPIESGITKNLEVEAGEKLNLFFKQKKDEKNYEVRFSLQKVTEDANIDVALQKIDQLFDVGVMFSDGGFQALEQKSTFIDGNKVYYEFDTSQMQQGQYAVQINNILSFGIQVKVDLLSGSYKLINLNDFMVDQVSGKNELTYEAFGHRGRFWFFELRMCYGETEVQFYNDYQSMKNKKNAISKKTVNENNTYVHYFPLDQAHVYVQVSNKNTDRSVFSMMAYNEQDLNDNPYQEVIARNDGTVKVDTSQNTISFQPLSINNFNDDSFTHKVIYRGYLSPDFKTMRFTKNCGNHLIEKAIMSPDYHILQHVVYFKGSKEFNNAPQVILNLPKLEKNKRYYGVVIADVHLLNREEGMIEPIRQTRAYYDEFIVISGKLEIPINLWSSILFILTALIVLGFFLKSYIFGDVYKYQDIHQNLRNITESGINTYDILESDFDIQEETPPKKAENKEIEMTETDDRKAPLDIDM